MVIMETTKKAYLKPEMKDVRAVPFRAFVSSEGGTAKRTGWDDGTADWQDDGFDW